MSERDELAELIRKAITNEDVLDKAALGGLDSDCAGYDWAIHAEAAADAILAGGWRAPLRTRWDCGHEMKVGNWGHNGECIQCALKRWEASESTWNQ